MNMTTLVNALRSKNISSALEIPPPEAERLSLVNDQQPVGRVIGTPSSDGFNQNLRRDSRSRQLQSREDGSTARR